jgi:peptidoglycan/LPS O-acetylase OafA/YrhL
MRRPVSVPPPAGSQRLETVDALRGLAALSVCWYHVAASGSLETKGWLRASAKFGWLGVDVFFVISGFVIPYALWRGGYDLRDFSRYLWKRAARIEPPYFAAIVLAVLLWRLSSLRPGYQGRPFELSPTHLLLHVGYLNTFAGRPWLNPDFWSLAIEFQYYLLMGLLVPFLASPRSRSRLLALGSLFAISVLFPTQPGQHPYVFTWLPLFLAGILTFQRWANIIGRTFFACGLVLAMVVASYKLGILSASVGGLTAVVIAFVHVRNRVLNFLGAISYSLYLTHGPVGSRVDNLTARFVQGDVQTGLAALFAVLIAVAFAYVFHRLVERPSRVWAALFKYKPVRPES